MPKKHSGICYVFERSSGYRPEKKAHSVKNDLGLDLLRFKNTLYEGQTGLLFYVGAYLTIAFQQGMASLREEQAVLFAEYQQTQAIRTRIHEAEQFYAHIRQLRHDMRAHLANIKGLAQSGEHESLTELYRQNG
ncbi:hypothetical protein [Acutalibacter muris]|uniref:hypothetical protein n=1 Tax=Acutalibacter muris TaxID=1796620 RepID=UPI00080F27AB|nr:hypothetical protein [Acutalibacter muris]